MDIYFAFEYFKSKLTKFGFLVFCHCLVLILKSEDMFENATRVMAEVTNFLGLPDHDFSSEAALEKAWGGGASNRYAPQSYEPIRNETRALLKEFFEPYNQRLYSLIDRDMGWE
jgi:hypothetical protein